MNTRWTRVRTFTLVHVSFALGFLVAEIRSWSTEMFGRTYSPHIDKDQLELRRHAHLANTAIRELKAYRAIHGYYPSSIDDIHISTYPSYIQDLFHAPYKPVYTYAQDDNGDSFILYMKTNWEDAIFFRSRHDMWTYRNRGVESELMPGRRSEPDN